MRRVLSLIILVCTISFLIPAQVFAAVMGDAITVQTFAAIEFAPYLKNARDKMISLAWTPIINNDNKMEHPHYLESYYLLATIIT